MPTAVRQISPLKKRMTAVLGALLLQTLLFYLSQPVSQLSAGILCILFGIPPGGETFWLILDILGMIGYALSFLLPSVLLVMLLRGRVSEYTGLRARFEISPAPAALITLGVVTAVSHLSNLFIALLDVAGVGLYYSDSPFPEGAAAIIVYFLSSVIIPAFVEEIAFRGVVLRALLPFGRWFAIITSGVLFGMMHCNPTQLLFASAAGIAMAYFVLEAESLWMSVGIHALNNAISFFGHWLYDCVSEKAYYVFYTVFDAIVVTLAAAGILIILYRRSVMRCYEERRKVTLREIVGALITPAGAAYVIVTILLSLQWCYLY